ncbi:MAG: hypothetical protein PHP45_10145 [Elusimicrobiales bacterium]|nr:hypothetical protein [Elusimicrobiales bacterium]
MVNKNRMIAVGLVAVSACFGGCTYTFPHQVVATNTPLTPNSYKVIGPASGKSCETHFLGMLVSKPRRLQSAIDNALDKTRGDALIELTIDNQSGGFLVGEDCTLVNGLAIKIGNADSREGK